MKFDSFSVKFWGSCGLAVLLVGFLLYAKFGSFNHSVDSLINTKTVAVTLNPGDRFVDAKYACDSSSCAEKIIYVHDEKKPPRTYYIKTVTNLGLASSLTIVVEK